ncbi:MAG: RNA ligase family protein [Petrotogales bacterium]
MKCIKIEYDSENYYDLYDLEIEGGTHNYIASGIVVHNTWCCFGVYPDAIEPQFPEQRIVVTSKGLSSKGLAFKDNEANENNLYMRMYRKLFTEEVLSHFKQHSDYAEVTTISGQPIFFLGEIFGRDVQDLQYGLNDIHFRLFDIYHGHPGRGQYLNVDELQSTIDLYGLDMELVPELYRGELTPDTLRQYTDGMDTITGSHIREGIVIKPLREMENAFTGRTILKSVSETYINRKNGTEYN